ncbi:Hypothetical predicted protein [Mytilus galloprovincialis]|uniref:Integrase catalytic domain-containing protein n=1 Tax=Mytilus galloprovincialis TaxID=29158 RepID=A0A8B6DLC5_MYTGA|nr:Hypothetical predicted protein [Mytilus galloprovincialis]
MFIEVKVNGRKAKMLIDTGATVSLISKQIFDSMHSHVLSPMDREILTANGSPLVLFGKTIIDIELNGYVCSNIAVVADLQIDGILGIDFQRNQDCVINLTRGSIWVNGRETRLHFEGQIGCYRVSVAQTVQLPPRSEVMVPGTVRGPVLPNQQVGIVEPTQEFVDTNKGLLGRILVKNQEKVPLRFMNLSDETQTIHEEKDTPVGYSQNIQSKNINESNKVSVITEIQEAQNADTNISKVREWLEKGERPSWEEVCGSYFMRSLWSQFNRLCIENELVVQSGVPMERIATDILGELPETENNNKYIVVISDYFTKWTEAFPMPNMEARTVAKILVEEVVARFGIPYTIHSDQGAQYESKLFSEMCNLLEIDKTKTTPYHPKSDGMVMVKTKTTPRLTKQVMLVMKETCPLCKEEYSDTDKLKNHVLTCAQDKSRLTCYQCNQMFKKKVYYARHMKKYHQHEDVKVVEVPLDKQEEKKEQNVQSKEKDNSSDESDSFSDDSESSSGSGKEFSDPGELKNLIGDISGGESFDDENVSPGPEKDKNPPETAKICDKVCLEGRITRKPTRPDKVLAPKKEKLLALLKESSNKQEIDGKVHSPDLNSKSETEPEEHSEETKSESQVTSENGKNKREIDSTFQDKAVQVEGLKHRKYIKTVTRYVENNREIKETVFEEFLSYD